MLVSNVGYDQPILDGGRFRQDIGALDLYFQMQGPKKPPGAPLKT